jgi:Cof subfamily protein (haloacid dehalogenase superfamily)
MKFKAVFIDLDGTLLTDKLVISPGSIEVLKRLTDCGVLISIVTARSPTASLSFYEQLGMAANPIICFNGALIQKQNTILHDINIETSSALKIIKMLKLFEVSVSIYRHYDWYAESIDSWINEEMQITKSGITSISFDELFSTDFRPNKILCMGTRRTIDEAEEHIKESGLFRDLNIHKSKNNYLEIINNTASKTQGIQNILQLYSISKDEIITIGDNFNDIDMLSFSKTSIAMGNAPEEVKKYATFVTDTNNEEGIKKALDTLIK